MASSSSGLHAPHCQKLDEAAYPIVKVHIVVVAVGQLLELKEMVCGRRQTGVSCKHADAESIGSPHDDLPERTRFKAGGEVLFEILKQAAESMSVPICRILLGQLHEGIKHGLLMQRGCHTRVLGLHGPIR